MNKEKINFMSHLKIFKFSSIVFLFFSLVMLSCSDSEEIVIIDGDAQNEEFEEGGIENDSISSTALTAKEITEAMSSGFNLGNTFENGINPTALSTITPIIDLYVNAGIKHIRIPVTWMDRFENDHLADEDGNLDTDHPRFRELVSAIDYALEQDLFVVINTHHEHWIKDHYDGSAEFNDKFTTLWTDISNYFGEYSERLIFETLNEPDGNLGEFDGSGPFPDPTEAIALSYTRQVNQVAYDAIRATGGANASRVIMVSTNDQGDETMIDEVYPNKASLPGGGNDVFLAIQIHTYNPWPFCGETGSNAAFPGTSVIEDGIRTAGAHSRFLDVPVNYGEFGVGRNENVAERNTDLVRGYYLTVASTTLAQNMSYTVWDDRGYFGLFTNNGGTLSFTNNIVPFFLN